MMTSSNGNIFRVTGPLCGEFTGPGEFPTQRPVMRSFDVFFDLRLNKRLSKQPWGWWSETPSSSLWRHRNVLCILKTIVNCQGSVGHNKLGDNQVEAQLDYGPGSEIGVDWKIGAMWPRKRGFKMAVTEFGYLLTNHHLVYNIIYQFLAMHGGRAWRQRIISLVCFCQQCHPSMASGDADIREMPPGSTPAICLCRNFVCISDLKKICGINQAENRVMCPDLLHWQTSTLASFREWSVVSAWLQIRAQPRNPCQPRNSA